MAVQITNHDGTRTYSILESHDLNMKNVYAKAQGTDVAIRSGINHRPELRLFSLNSVDTVTINNNGVITKYLPSHKLKGMKVAAGGNYTDPQGQQWLCDEIKDDEYIQRLREENVSGQVTLVKLETPIVTLISPVSGMPLQLKQGDNHITCNVNMDIKYIANDDYFLPKVGWIIKKIVIQPNEWKDKIYTLNDDLIKINSVQEITLPSYLEGNDAMVAAIQQANIRDHSQGDGWLKLICTGQVPMIPIELRVAFKEEKELTSYIEIDGEPTVTKTISILASEWASGVYQLNDKLITTTSNQEILPPIATDTNGEMIKAIQKANIVDGGQGSGWSKFKCLGKIPTTTIELRIMFRGEK